MKKIQKRGLILIVGLLVAAIFMQWYRSHSEKSYNSVDTNQPVAVKAALVNEGFIRPSLVINGSVEGKKEAVITTKAQGIINRLAVKTGDRVSNGTVLALIEQTSQQAGVAKSREQINSAALTLDQTRRNYERISELHRQGAASKAEFENAEMLFKNAQVAYNIALSDSQLADEALKSTVISAPFGGSVAECLVEEGEVVFPGSKLLTLVDDTSLKITATVSADRVIQLTRGQKGVFTSTLYPGKEYDCTVTAVSNRADPSSRAYTVELDLSPDAAGYLKPGMFGEVRLNAEEIKRTVMPREAVITLDEDGKAEVFVIREGKSQRIKIATAETDDSHIAVVSGLIPGERVVVFGQSLLKNGTPVIEGE
ncbi:MAG: efflux RND transporter periplasmic adaptor subunit [Bacillota bacterium]